MKIRPALPDDAAPLTALLNVIIAKGGTTAHETPFTPDRFLPHYIAGPEVICCHLAETERPLGFQGLSLWDALPPGWGDIGTFVAEEARGSGAAAGLFAATCAAARAKGLKTLNATIRADNVLGLAFYSRMGFREYGQDPDFRLADGRQVGKIHKRFDL